MRARELPNMWWRSYVRDRRYLLNTGVVGLIYFVLAKTGLSLAQDMHQVSAVWPPAGFALVVVLLMGLRYWPAIFLGAFAANALASEPLFVAAGIAIGNTLEAVVGAALVRRFSKFSNELARPRDLLALYAAGIICTAVAALNGPAWLALGGVIPWSHYRDAALLWWQGDMLGILLIGPMLLAYLNRRAWQIFRGRVMEAGILLASVFAVSIVVFDVHGREPIAYTYLVVPFLVWAALRFTQIGVVTATLVIAITAIWATVSGLGPFAKEGTFEQDLTQLQLFLVVMGSTALFLGMSITARLNAEAKLRHQTADLERLDDELKEANRRVTNILAGILDEGAPKRRNADSSRSR